MKTISSKALLRVLSGATLLYCLSSCAPRIGGPLYTPTLPNVGAWASSGLNQAISQRVSQGQYRITSGIYTQQQFTRSVKDTRDAIKALSYHSVSKAADYDRQLEEFLSAVKARHINWANQYAAQDANEQLNSIRSNALHTLQETKMPPRN